MQNLSVDIPKTPAKQANKANELKVDVFPYSIADSRCEAKANGQMFVLNKTTYNWRSLKGNKPLTSMLQKRRLQHTVLNGTSEKGKEVRPTLHPFDESMASQVLKLNEVNKSNPPASFSEMTSLDDASHTKPSLTMAVCIPCYDEEWCEMSGTIRSFIASILVHRTRHFGVSDLHIVMVLIQDGKKKASDSFKQGIVDELGCPTYDWMNSLTSNDSDANQIMVLAPDAEVNYPALMHDYGSDIYQGTTFYPIVVTKSRNCMKFNSHAIFFSLCNLLEPDFCFLTDCGTLYEPMCLHHLITYLARKHDKVTGVTGRQRAMLEGRRAEVQEYPSWSPLYDPIKVSTFQRIFQNISWWTSPAPQQAFEYELSCIMSTAMFNTLGAHPVLPGPCQLLWWDHLAHEGDEKHIRLDGPLDMYFRHLQMDPVKAGLIKTSTLLAEDRVLSLAMVLKNLGMQTMWVNDATFIYEPMMSWGKLLGQRRRWINGTFASFAFYLLDQEGRLQLTLTDKGWGYLSVIIFAWWLQMMQIIMTNLSAAFYSIALYESGRVGTLNFPGLFGYLDLTPLVSFTFDAKLVIPTFFFIIYVIWAFMGWAFGKKPTWMNKNLYTTMMEAFYATINVITSILTVMVLVNILSVNSSVLVIFCITFVAPFFMAISLQPTSAIYYVMYGIPYLIQICQYAYLVPAFAVTRLNDFSWGNRDVELSHDHGMEVKMKAARQTQFYWINIYFNIILVSLNIGLFVVYFYFITILGPSARVWILLILVLFFVMPTSIQILFSVIFITKVVSKKIVDAAQYLYILIRYRGRAAAENLGEKMEKELLEAEAKRIEKEDQSHLFDKFGTANSQPAKRPSRYSSRKSTPATSAATSPHHSTKVTHNVLSAAVRESFRDAAVLEKSE